MELFLQKVNKYSLILLFVNLLLLVNIYFIQNLFLGIALSLIFAIYLGLIWAEKLFPTKNLTNSLYLGFLTIIAFYSLIGALFFYIANLSSLSIVLIIEISVFLSILVWPQTFNLNKFRISLNNFDYKKIIILLTYLILNIFLILTILNNKTTEAVNTPWSLVPAYFFFLYFTAASFLIFILQINFSKTLKILLTAIFIFITFSFGIFIFPLGYGFDPLIHETTEKIISQTGTISPKPFYYIGQYSLITLLNKISLISVEILNKFFVPFLFSIFLPWIIYFTYKKSQVAPLFALVIPWVYFSLSTPQSFSFLFFILIIFLYLKNTDKKFLFFLALTNLFIHPFSGIFSLIFVIYLYLRKTKLAIPFLMLACFALITLFGLNSLISEQASLKFEIKPFFSALPTFAKSIQRDNWFLNLTYLIQTNLKIFYLLFTAFASLLFLKKTFFNKYFPIIILSIIILVNLISIKSIINFDFLIYYEQNNYLTRLFDLFLLTLLPIFILAMIKIWTRLKSFKLIRTFILATILLTSFYFIYPRADDYYLSHSYNISKADFDAVNWIENNTQGDYAVLANQMTSLAAIKNFGFKKYFKTDLGEIFYYPLPTSSPLYNIYLMMVYQEPSNEYIKAVKDLTKTDTVYFVLNKYWWNSELVAKKAEYYAKEKIKLDNKNITIFRY